MAARSSRKITLVVCVAVVGSVALLLIAAPIITATAIKLWLARLAQQNGWTISYRALEAPLLRPVTLRDVKIVAARSALDVSRVEARLRLSAMFDPSRGRMIRDLAVSDLHGEVAAGDSQPMWGMLLADNFSVTASALTIRCGATAIEVADAELVASELHPGRFRVRTLAVRSPALQQSFADLRGGTSWEYNRLTIGGVTLMRGFDVDVVRIDLAGAHEKHVTIDTDADLFGGKLRASMSADEQTAERTWDIAASGSEISLGRMSDALGFSTRTSGSLHALKFTFRGDFDALPDATASVWTEITGFTWRDRTADVVMLGASYYGRQINVEQLYVKQRRNELTLSGEFAAPRASADLPDLRGDISAHVNDLGEFARLFGGSSADFAGELVVNGDASAQEHKLTGQLSISGKSLKVFGAPADALDARLLLSQSAVEVDRCELRRDSAGLPPLSIHGACDFANANALSARLRFDQPLALRDESNGCITEVRLATSPTGDHANTTRLTSLELQGPLFRTGWTITAAHDEDERPKTFRFCTQTGNNGGALVIAPLR